MINRIWSHDPPPEFRAAAFYQLPPIESPGLIAIATPFDEATLRDAFRPAVASHSTPTPPPVPTTPAVDMFLRRMWWNMGALSGLALWRYVAEIPHAFAWWLVVVALIFLLDMLLLIRGVKHEHERPEPPPLSPRARR
jgi:hypothetical protein